MLGSLRLRVDNRVGLDLDHGGVIDQPRDLDHGQRGPDLVEELTVNFAHFLPLLNIGHEDPGADHVGRLAAQASIAATMISRARQVCPLMVGAYWPSASMPTVPVTAMKSPARIARE